MATILVSGDWHGNPEALDAVDAAADGFTDLLAVFQGGDMGYHFKPAFITRIQETAARLGVPIYWLRGNHDNVDAINRLYAEAGAPDGPCALWPDIAPDVFWVPDGTIVTVDGTRVLMVGGAISTDRNGRGYVTEYWPGEGLSYAQTERALSAGRADIMLCHDAPYGVEPLESRLASMDRTCPEDVARNARQHRTALAAIADHAQPRLIIHGHHHHWYDGRYKRMARVRGLGRDGQGEYLNTVVRLRPLTHRAEPTAVQLPD